MDSREPMNLFHRAFHLGRFRLLLAAIPLLIWLVAPLAGQSAGRMWAAQTGADQVTLSWDSIPDTTEYRIYLGEIGKVDERRPELRLSAGSRRAVVTDLRRISHGIYLLAAGFNGRVLQRAPFNPLTVATTYSPIAPPTEVTAEATSPTEVTLSWSPVPGATAYYIGRAVGGSGVRPLCDLCSTEANYVDRSAQMGFPHTYIVSAIFPWGPSRTVASNQVTPGVPVVPTTSGQAGIPPTTTTGGGTTASLPTATTTHTGTPTTTPGGTTASPATTTTTTHAATPVTATQTTTSNSLPAGILGQVLGGVAGNTVSPPTGVTATLAGPSAVRVTWQASPTTGLTEYRITRRVNGGAVEQLNAVDPGTLTYSDTFFPVTMFSSGPVRVSYSVKAFKSTNFSTDATTGQLIVQPSVSTGVTAPAGTAATGCKLDYQRADNMWAAFGRPDGPLGTETIALSPGQDRVFNTDWKYEKTHNDGSNYYGSHLRIATNSSAHTIRLQLRTTTLTGLVVFVNTGSDTFWIRMEPGKSQQFQADLMEVFCEK